MSVGTLRIDKWLFFARFCKSRTLAGKMVAGGKVRLNDNPIAKAHVEVKPDDVLTFPLGPHIRIIKVVELGTQRGPAPEARTLYEDLDPPDAKSKPDRPPQVAPREPGSGRPTKAQRRATDRLRPGAD